MKRAILRIPAVVWCVMTACILTAAPPVFGAQIDVLPGQSIQAAIDAAAVGDEVVVAAGLYVERISFKGKAITVRSADPADPQVVAGTIIEAAANGPTVSLTAGEGAGALLDGFTIRHQAGFREAGVSITGSPTISRCVITGNNGYWGGGVAVMFGGAPRIVGCTIQGNVSDLSGGGILVYRASATIDSCVITGNRAGASGGSDYGGGGVSISGSNTQRFAATITNSVISNNQGAWEGGGIHAFNHADLIVQGSSVTGNATQSLGGGIFVRVYSSVQVVDSTVSDNSAAFEGAGLFTDALCTIGLRNSTFSGNGTTNPNHYGGGGAYLSWAVVDIQGCTFRGNRSMYGGGVLTSSSDVAIADTLFEDNAATVAGGGLALNNHYFNGRGSSLARTTFRNNRARSGGGASLNGLLAPIEDCVFSGNAAEAGGGGLELFGASSPGTLRRCSITGNTAGTQGGGVTGGPLTIVDSDLSGNAALYFGGAVYGGNLDITNSTITKNLVTYTSPWQGLIYGGAGVYSRNGIVRIANCTLADNASNYNSGAFYGDGAALVLLNSVLWNPGAPAEIHLERAPSLSVTFSDIRGGYPGAGNIAADPLFVKPALGDYRLRDQSPCIDKGTNAGAPATDKNGAPRPQDGNDDGIAVCDQGAFEGGVYTNVAPVANAGEDQPLHAGDTASLNGTASFDPDENYQLTYQWTIVAKPAGSGAVLSFPASSQPEFIADLPGVYLVELVVTDSLGLRSLPDQVLVSTGNAPPVAAAGDDQPVVVRGTLVQLEGGRSYDPDGDEIGFQWSLVSVPEGSQAALSDPTAVRPTFAADVNGTFIAQLVVHDAWSTSDPDTVTVSFANLPPVADPGGNRSVLQGETVTLDGSRSSDPNRDPLGFRWSFVAVPAGSGAQLADTAAVQPSFVADLPGLYVVSLVVGDGLVESEARTVQVYAVSFRDALIDRLQGLIVTVNGIPDELLKNPNMKGAFTNKITEVIRMVEQGQYAQAAAKLENDVRAKTDGCAAAGEPDANDWIRDCGAQAQVYPQIDEILGLLAQLGG